MGNELERDNLLSTLFDDGDHHSKCMQVAAVLS